MADYRLTYYVVYPFTFDWRGYVVPGEPVEAPNKATAIVRARRHAKAGGAAVAFSRSGSPMTGEWDDAVILAKCGNLPESAFESAAEAA